MLAEDTLDATNPAERIHDRVLADGARDDVAVLTIRVTTLDLEHFSRCWTFDAGDYPTTTAARAEFRDFLLSRNSSSEHIFNAELIYAELLGNVVRYTPGSVDIRVDWNGDNPVLNVLDTGPAFQFLSRLPHDVLVEGGCGLYLVSALAEDFHVSRRRLKSSDARAVLYSTAPTLRVR